MAVALFDLVTVFLLTQTKAHNIPLYLLFRFQLFFLSKSIVQTPHTDIPI
jgi:ethanolaminephosphotransferase